MCCGVRACVRILLLAVDYKRIPNVKIVKMPRLLCFAAHLQCADRGCAA